MIVASAKDVVWADKEISWGTSIHVKKVMPPSHSSQCIADKLALVRPLVCLLGALLSHPASGTILHTWAADDPKNFAAIIVRNWEIPPEFSLCNADLEQRPTLESNSCRIAVLKLHSFAKDLNFVSIPAGDTLSIRAVLQEIRALEREDHK